MTDPITIGKQCSAVRILINAAESGKKFKPSECKHFKAQWEAAFDTLIWLQLNEAKIKEALRNGQFRPDKTA